MQADPSLRDDLAGGLRAAFESEAPAAQQSVLRRLQQKTGSPLDLHLGGVDEDSGLPAKSGLPAQLEAEGHALRDPAGRYQVLGEIGRGGVGVVYQGRDQDLGRDVAMKVLRAEFARQPEIVERFVEEAQIGGQLQHPGIVPVYELGLQQGERPYFAMKLVKGETLAALLARRSHPGEDRRKALGIFEQICQTLAYAHARRVVHRDLKPANVMLGSFGEVQVVDWGFAKVLPGGEEMPSPQQPPQASSAASVISTVRSDSGRGSRSIAGSLMGTPAYMSPEQARGDVELMDRRSDVFGLGAILCEILTGEAPYLAADGDLIAQAARADLRAAYTRIEESGADQAMIELCKLCLATARQARPASGREVANAVSQYLSSVEERAREAQIRAAEAKVRARAAIWLSAAAVLLLALGGGGYLYVEQQVGARRDRASQRVAAALDDANVRLGEARARRSADLGPWTRALDAARQAASLAGDADVSASQRAAAGALLETAQKEQEGAAAEAARFAKQEHMRERLLDVRNPSDEIEMRLLGATLSPSSATARLLLSDESYAETFAWYLDGRDLKEMPVEAGVAALSGPMEVELAAALDHWVAGRRQLARIQDSAPPFLEQTQVLAEIAIALDPDPWRKALRAAVAGAQPQREALFRLHAEARLDALPAVSSLQLADALARAGGSDEATSVLESACDLYPADFGCALHLGRSYLLAGEGERAAARFCIARALRPKSVMTLNGLGASLELQGRMDEALVQYRRAIELDPMAARAHVNVGRVLYKQGRHDEAIALYRRAIEIEPRFARAHASLGIAFTNQGRMKAAIESLRRAIELDPRLAEPHVSLGLALEGEGQLESAIASYRRAIELDSKIATAHYDLGNALLRQGKVEEAEASYRRCLELDPDYAEAHTELGGILSDSGRTEEALASLQRALALDPELAVAHCFLGTTLVKQRRFEDAIASLRRAIELDPELARAHFNLGGVLGARGQLDAAIASYRRATELGPDIALGHYWLGVALAKQGRLEEAIASHRRAIELDPELASAQNGLGVALAGLGRLDEAIACYRRAIELDPELAAAHAGIGGALSIQGQIDDAVAHLRRAIDLDPRLAKAHFNLGTTLSKRGEVEAAIGSYRRAVELDPEMAMAHYNLGFALSGQSRSDEALECYRRAEEIWSRGSDAHAVEWLGRSKSAIARLEPLAQRTRELLALARGEREAASGAELTDAAELVHQRGEHALAARTYARAFAAFPTLIAVETHRYDAACAAAMASCERGADAAELPEAERAALREQARVWLEAEVARRREDLAKGDESASAAKRLLARAQQDAELSGVRGDELRGLPDAERTAWEKLWDDIASVLRGAG